MASLKDTLLAIDMLRSWNFPQEKIKLVINATNEACNVQPQEVKRMLGRDVFWSIPYDRNISTATQLGMPVVRGQAAVTGLRKHRRNGLRPQWRPPDRAQAQGTRNTAEERTLRAASWATSRNKQKSGGVIT